MADPRARQWRQQKPAWWHLCGSATWRQWPVRGFSPFPRTRDLLKWLHAWGGRRLSGFLPVQSVYADFYVKDEFWPDFDPQHFAQALAWYTKQDQTLGG